MGCSYLLIFKGLCELILLFFLAHMLQIFYLICLHLLSFFFKLSEHFDFYVISALKFFPLVFLLLFCVINVFFATTRIGYILFIYFLFLATF